MPGNGAVPSDLKMSSGFPSHPCSELRSLQGVTTVEGFRWRKNFVRSAQEVHHDWIHKGGHTMLKDGRSSVTATVSSLAGTLRMGVNR